MKKLLRGVLFAVAISVLSSQGAHAAWSFWSPKSWGRTTPTTPTTPPPTTTTSPYSGGSTGGSTGGGTGGGTPAVPEPGTMLLMASGAAALAYARRRQTRKTQE